MRVHGKVCVCVCVWGRRGGRGGGGRTMNSRLPTIYPIHFFSFFFSSKGCGRFLETKIDKIRPARTYNIFGSFVYSLIRLTFKIQETSFTLMMS